MVTLFRLLCCLEARPERHLLRNLLVHEAVLRLLRQLLGVVLLLVIIWLHVFDQSRLDWQLDRFRAQLVFKVSHVRLRLKFDVLEEGGDDGD